MEEMRRDGLYLNLPGGGFGGGRAAAERGGATGRASGAVRDTCQKEKKRRKVQKNKETGSLTVSSSSKALKLYTKIRKQIGSKKVELENANRKSAYRQPDTSRHQFRVRTMYETTDNGKSFNRLSNHFAVLEVEITNVL